MFVEIFTDSQVDQILHQQYGIVSQRRFLTQYYA